MLLTTAYIIRFKNQNQLKDITISYKCLLKHTNFFFFFLMFDAMRWRMVFSSTFEVNEMFCLLNRSNLFTNQKQLLKCVRQKLVIKNLIYKYYLTNCNKLLKPKKVLDSTAISRTAIDRKGPPEVFLQKGVLEIYSKFTGEHSCRSVISINLQSNWNYTLT